MPRTRRYIFNTLTVLSLSLLLATVGCAIKQPHTQDTRGQGEQYSAPVLFERVLAGDIHGLELRNREISDQDSTSQKTIATLLFMMQNQIDLDRDRSILLQRNDKLSIEASRRANRIEVAAKMIGGKLKAQLKNDRSNNLPARLNLVQALVLSKESEEALTAISRISTAFPNESDLNQRNIIHHLAEAEYAYALQFERDAVLKGKSKSLEKAMSKYNKLVALLGGSTEMLTDSVWSRIWWHSWYRILRIALWRSAGPEIIQSRLSAIRELDGTLDRHGLAPLFDAIEQYIQAK